MHPTIMKITTPSFLTFFLLILFAFSSTTTTKAEIILTADGEILQNRGYYLFSPAYSIGGRVIIPTPTIKEEEGFNSSLAVVSALNVRGWPVRIAARELTIHVSSFYSLFLSFAEIPGEWSVVNSSHLGLTILVGDRADFGSSYVDGIFNIRPYNSKKFEYYLRFCRLSSSTGDYTLCGKVGIVEEKDNNGNNTGFKRLVVKDDDPLVFKFEKPQKTTGISMVV